MRLNRSVFLKLAVAGALATVAVFGTTEASAQVHWSIGVTLPGFVVSEPAPVYYAPAPLYVQPAPIYYQSPPPVYYRQRPRAYYAPAPVYYEPAYRGEGRRFGRREWDGDHHRDRHDGEHEE